MPARKEGGGGERRLKQEEPLTPSQAEAEDGGPHFTNGEAQMQGAERGALQSARSSSPSWGQFPPQTRQSWQLLSQPN